MPLDPISVFAIMQSSLLGAGLLGVANSQLALGLTNALSVYGQTTMVVTTIDVGTAGVGKGTGAGVVLPIPTLLSSFSVSLPSAGIAGLSMPQLALGISTGYSTALASAIINTVHPSVGVGSGKLQIVPNTLVAIQTFITAFLSAGLTGIMAVPLATAVATGLDAVLPSAVGVVAITGPPSSVSAAGAGSGKLV